MAGVVYGTGELCGADNGYSDNHLVERWSIFLNDVPIFTVDKKG
jgi:hypothetical protein